MMVQPARNLLKPVGVQKPHIRQVVAFLKDQGAVNVVVTQPRHYRVRFDMRGAERTLTVPTSPRSSGNEVRRARQALRRMGCL